MGEYFPGRITIGGILHLTVPQALTLEPENLTQEDWNDKIELFLAKVNEKGFDFGETDHNLKSPKDIPGELDDKNQLVCTDSEASYGEFEELEELCRELGLSYDRWSDAKYEFEACMSIWRPGMERPFDCQADKNEHPVIDRAPVLAAYQMMSGDQDWQLSDVKALLKGALYPDQPETPVEPSPLTTFQVAP